MSEREFSACWFRCRESLYHAAMQQLRGDSYLADDAVGRLLVTLCKQREKMPSESPGGFSFRRHSRKMLQYAVSRVVKYRDRQKRQGGTVPLEVVTEQGDTLESAAVMQKAADAQREAASKAERSVRAVQALRTVKLTARMTRVIQMKADGVTFEDMGQQLKMSRQSACQTYQRAVKRVQEAGARLENGRDTGSAWTGEQLHTWGSAAVIEPRRRNR